MKLKRIKDNEIVVDKYEYARLVRNDNQLREHNEQIFIGRKPNYFYIVHQDSGDVIVCMHGFGACIDIRCFNSDDAEYNIVCAEELVELLNKEQ